MKVFSVLLFSLMLVAPIINAEGSPYVMKPQQPIKKQFTREDNIKFCQGEAATIYMTLSREADGHSIDRILAEFIPYCRGEQNCIEYRKRFINHAYWNIPIPPVSQRPYFNRNSPTSQDAVAQHLHNIEKQRQMAALEREQRAAFDACMQRVGKL